MVVGFVSCEKRFPILYVYTVANGSCYRGFPDYIKVSIEQALLLQPDCDIIMASNYADCLAIENVIDSIPGVIKLDTTKIESKRSREFAKASETIFSGSQYDDLWVTSAQRFFSMEDFMISKNYTEMLHVEADNLLYGKVSSHHCSSRSNFCCLLCIGSCNLNFYLSVVITSTQSRFNLV